MNRIIMYITNLLYNRNVISAMFPIFSPTKILDSLILMQILREGPLHGYALSNCIEEKFGWKPSQTAIYNSLKSMENENLVTSEEIFNNKTGTKVFRRNSSNDEKTNDEKFLTVLFLCSNAR
ncbi:MAG: PadR family transcriptional regulator [Asgard group archaeon]|nr:PadR family transcriptional regulator [Asgard group archaeon]